jgi:pimeloyl-ACP methyl ester carboxylesterase
MTLWILALLACSGGDGTDTVDADTDTDADTGGEGPGVEVVQLRTTDGVALEGDLYGQPDPVDGPGFCLLHMIPPGNDRTGWPLSFIEALRAQGWGVLAIDRRGAGASDGDPKEAYTGPNGVFDVEACIGALTDRGYGPIAVIGASNGTTSMIDYAVWAEREGGVSLAAMGFMTGGSYTEGQTAMEAVPAVPAVFTYSTAERGWSVDQQGLHDDVWVFEEYPQGDHGTRMFEARPEVTNDLVAFFASVL